MDKNKIFIFPMSQFFPSHDCESEISIINDSSYINERCYYCSNMKESIERCLDITQEMNLFLEEVRGMLILIGKFTGMYEVNPEYEELQKFTTTVITLQGNIIAEAKGIALKEIGTLEIYGRDSEEDMKHIKECLSCQNRHIHIAEKYTKIDIDQFRYPPKRQGEIGH